MNRKLASTVPAPTFRKAKPVRLFEQAVEQIKSLIMDGHLKPGDKLPSELELSQLLNVSRSSVREALRSLESGGIVQVKSGAGTFIAEDALILSSASAALLRLTQREDLVLDVLKVRAALECLAASCAAHSITKEHIVLLQNNVEQQDALSKKGGSSKNLVELAELDAEFHIAISQASSNEIVHELIQILVPSLKEDNEAIFILEKGLKLVDEHRAILNAIIQGDPTGAEQSMRVHIERVMSEVQRLHQNAGGAKNHPGP